MQPLLIDLLSEDVIELDVGVADWEEAVQFGGRLLEKKGLIDHRYIDAMINTVKELGAYIVIAPGIAMPHARPESGAKQIGVSIITLKNPVNFGNKDNDPVKIVISLCAIDHVTHLGVLSELALLLQDRRFLSLLLSSRDKNQILEVIRNGLD